MTISAQKCPLDVTRSAGGGNIQPNISFTISFAFFIKNKSHSVLSPLYSLLRPIPNERTCEDAGIPPEFCICQREIAINNSHAIVHRAARAIVARINDILEVNPSTNKCSTRNFAFAAFRRQMCSFVLALNTQCAALSAL